MIGFFATEKHENTSPIDREFAGRLAKLLIESRRADKANVGRWADEFRMLRSHRTPAEIERALAWLELNLTSEFCPKVFSASSFCRKFPQIQAAMSRGTDRWDSLPDVEITDEARRVERNLGGLIWPGDEKRDELRAIQVSLNNYRAWLNLLREAKVRHPDKAGLFECLLALGTDPSGFVECWFMRLHRVAWEVEGWAGKLARHVVRTDSPKFRKVINGWLQEYLGEGDHWEKLERLLKEGDGK